jgi:hypothetical protein
VPGEFLAISLVVGVYCSPRAAKNLTRSSARGPLFSRGARVVISTRQKQYLMLMAGREGVGRINQLVR